MKLKSEGHGTGVKTLFATALFLLIPTLVHAESISVCAAEPNLVCQIDNLSIDGTIYDVTFGNTPDYTFSGNQSGAVDAYTAIDSAINGDPETGIGDGNVSDDSLYCSKCGPTDYYIAFSASSSYGLINADAIQGPFAPPASTGNAWFLQGLGLSSYPVPTEVDGNLILVPEFSEVASSAPEPATPAMMLIGVALLALANRKRCSQLVRQAMPVR